MKINNVDYLNVPQQINKNKLDIKDLDERVLNNRVNIRRRFGDRFY